MDAQRQRRRHRAGDHRPGQEPQSGVIAEGVETEEQRRWLRGRRLRRGAGLSSSARRCRMTSSSRFCARKPGRAVRPEARSAMPGAHRPSRRPAAARPASWPRRFRGRPDREHEMVINRLAISTLLMIYLRARGLLQVMDARQAVIADAVYGCISLGFFIHILWMPRTCHTRRVVGMCVDFGALTYCLMSAAARRRCSIRSICGSSSATASASACATSSRPWRSAWSASAIVVADDRILARAPAISHRAARPA